jgi:hypothetical protein
MIDYAHFATPQTQHGFTLRSQLVMMLRSAQHQPVVADDLDMLISTAVDLLKNPPELEVAPPPIPALGDEPVDPNATPIEQDDSEKESVEENAEEGGVEQAPPTEEELDALNFVEITAMAKTFGIPRTNKPTMIAAIITKQTDVPEVAPEADAEAIPEPQAG